ncbi:hypothetical protein LTR66_002406 [Elasticomyces elasticus]|nr:hypothetical protein LTR66_002406 [Elasticomyces elasticus]
MEVIKAYKITHKLGYITGDNHGSNDKMCHFISAALSEFVSQAFLFTKDTETDDVAITEAEADASNGTGADENLVKRLKRAEPTSWRQMGLMGMLHNIHIYVYGSSSRTIEFRALAGKLLPRDNDTRWNSWFTMIDKALRPPMRQALMIYQSRYSELAADVLSHEDWKTIAATRLFLQPFWRVTLETEGKVSILLMAAILTATGDKAKLDLISKSMDFLVKHYERSIFKYAGNPTLSNSIITSCFVFDKY